jgi:hypothetical protein
MLDGLIGMLYGLMAFIRWFGAWVDWVTEMLG